MINRFFPVKYGPAVCASGHDYIIAVPVKCNLLMKIKVGENEYLNVSDGIRKRDCVVQKFKVPMSQLDKAGKYTVICETGRQYENKKTVSSTYSFRPVPSDRAINIYHISDTHGLFNESVKAADNFGKKPDLLILNGDISSSSETVNDILLNYKIAYAVTKGEIPCIITRGNHDLRGSNAEHLPEIMPYGYKKPYYTTVLGDTWYLILDCGEDKSDNHREYYSGADYHNFRLEETEFIRDIINNSSSEYGAENIKKRILISHIAINHEDNDMCKGERPFNIEHEIYDSWCRLISEKIRPDLYITGHLHEFTVYDKDSEFNHRKLPCATLVGGKPEFGKHNIYTGAGIILYDDKAEITFTDNLNSNKKSVILNF